MVRSGAGCRRGSHRDRRLVLFSSPSRKWRWLRCGSFESAARGEQSRCRGRNRRSRDLGTLHSVRAKWNDVDLFSYTRVSPFVGGQSVVGGQDSRPAAGWNLPFGTAIHPLLGEDLRRKARRHSSGRVDIRQLAGWVARRASDGVRSNPRETSARPWIQLTVRSFASAWPTLPSPSRSRPMRIPVRDRRRRASARARVV
jgi:hypothetical protein